MSGLVVDRRVVVKGKVRTCIGAVVMWLGPLGTDTSGTDLTDCARIWEWVRLLLAELDCRCCPSRRRRSSSGLQCASSRLVLRVCMYV